MWGYEPLVIAAHSPKLTPTQAPWWNTYKLIFISSLENKFLLWILYAWRGSRRVSTYRQRLASRVTPDPNSFCGEWLLAVNMSSQGASSPQFAPISLCGTTNPLTIFSFRFRRSCSEWDSQRSSSHVYSRRQARQGRPSLGRTFHPRQQGGIWQGTSLKIKNSLESHLPSSL